MGMDVLSNDITIALDEVAHQSLFEGKDRPIIGGVFVQKRIRRAFRSSLRLNEPSAASPLSHSKR